MIINDTSKTLTLFCESGLANRLRVLVSGIAAAKITGRAFRMIWPRTPACYASFRELFINSWPVIDTDNMEQLRGFHKSPTTTPLGTIDQFIADPKNDIVFGATDWIVDSHPQRSPEMYSLCCKLLGELEPLPEITKRTSEIRQFFLADMIGVHLRRGDYLRKRPDVAWNTQAALRVVDRYLDKYPAAGIFLCSDDGALNWKTGAETNYEGVRETFYKRYGNRVICSSPRSLDRRTKESAQDALADLWLLRSTDMIVGTVGSSFSYLSAFDRNVEHVWVGSKTPAYALIHWLALLTGLYWLIRRLYRTSKGVHSPFHRAWYRFTKTLPWRKKT